MAPSPAIRQRVDFSDPYYRAPARFVARKEAVLPEVRPEYLEAKKVPLKDGDYTMDHTALVYLMDRDGRFVAPFNIKRRPEEAAADLKRYL